MYLFFGMIGIPAVILIIALGYSIIETIAEYAHDAHPDWGWMEAQRIEAEVIARYKKKGLDLTIRPVIDQQHRNGFHVVDSRIPLSIVGESATRPHSESPAPVTAGDF